MISGDEKSVIRDGAVYGFSLVLGPEDDNEDVYEKSVKPVIDRWVGGVNAAFIVFGQTASGKTFTQFGDESTEGVVYSALSDAFAHVAAHPENQFMLCASYIEVYNEQCFDLLRPEGSQDEPLPIREKDCNFFVDGLTERLIGSPAEAFELLHVGWSNRTIGSSYLHDRSTRGHAVFRLALGQVCRADGTATVSELSFVDLAGAELLSDQFGAQQQRETKAVNLSLSALKAVIEACAQEAPYIGYRQSALTKLLQNALGRNSITTLCCCINPAAQHAPMSKRTVLFGQRVKNRPRKNCFLAIRPGASGQAANSWAGPGSRDVFGPGMADWNPHPDDGLWVCPIMCSGALWRPVDESEMLVTKVRLSADSQVRSRALGSQLQAVARQTATLSYREDRIPTGAGTVFARSCGPEAGPVALFLPGYPGGWDDWEYLYAPLAALGLRVVGVDMPGFGQATGQRQTSRTERFGEPGGPNETVAAVLDALGVTSKRKGILFGFDWGGGIALSLAAQQPAAQQRLRGICVIHPSWTAPLGALAKVRLPVLMLWVPAEQNHSFLVGRKMARALPNCTLVCRRCLRPTGFDRPPDPDPVMSRALQVRLDCGPFAPDKPYNVYACIAPQITDHVAQWVRATLGPAATATRARAHPAVVPAAAADSAPSPPAVSPVTAGAAPEAPSPATPDPDPDLAARLELLLADRTARLWRDRGTNPAAASASRLPTHPSLSARARRCQYTHTARTQPHRQRPAYNHLVDRPHGMREARGSIPLSSILYFLALRDPLARTRWAVARLDELLRRGEAQTYYEAYLGRGDYRGLRPDAVALFGSLPVLLPYRTTAQDLHRWGIWPRPPSGVDQTIPFDAFPRYLPGRQVLVRVSRSHHHPPTLDLGLSDMPRLDAPQTTVQASIWSAHPDAPDWLAYAAPPMGTLETTHRATVLGAGQAQGTIRVAVDLPGAAGALAMDVALGEVVALNQPTAFQGDPAREGCLLEDGIRCKYSDFLTRAKMVEAALAIRHLVGDLHFELAADPASTPPTYCAPPASAATAAEPLHPWVAPSREPLHPVVAQQLRCIAQLVRVMDCTHFVHTGLDKGRSGRPDVGRLAHHGQGHCHTVASVVAALLMPFARSLGLEVRFRAGWFIEEGRDLDPATGHPFAGTDGLPRPCDDHTWLEVTLLPSLRTYVVDPSFAPVVLTMDQGYSKWGLRHAHPKCECCSRPPPPPTNTTNWPVDLARGQIAQAVAPVRRQCWSAREGSVLAWADLDLIDWINEIPPPPPSPADLEPDLATDTE
ncbi:putative kinesin motor domain protein [Paratrimastix pyriformis]|uniref:Kinesin motor domain protein n=1 Tax=Paratrimastix pyriformis TaxID=342808 RepID=A0ABQ8UV74_9EUKA|nr:putative kinesin motor domain protein [Paratrimastix pyriformis]